MGLAYSALPYPNVTGSRRPYVPSRRENATDSWRAEEALLLAPQPRDTEFAEALRVLDRTDNQSTNDGGSDEHSANKVLPLQSLTALAAIAANAKDGYYRGGDAASSMCEESMSDQSEPEEEPSYQSSMMVGRGIVHSIKPQNPRRRSKEHFPPQHLMRRNVVDKHPARVWHESAPVLDGQGASHWNAYVTDAVLRSGAAGSLSATCPIRSNHNSHMLSRMSGARVLRFSTEGRGEYGVEYTAEAMRELGRFSDTLVELSFISCLELSDTHLEAVARLRHLKGLALDCCVHVTDDSLESIARVGQSLERLSLRACKQIARVGVLSSLKNLRELSLEQCPWVEDSELAILLGALLELVDLNLANCYRITTKAFVDAWLIPITEGGCLAWSPRCERFQVGRLFNAHDFVEHVQAEPHTDWNRLSAVNARDSMRALPGGPSYPPIQNPLVGDQASLANSMRTLDEEPSPTEINSRLWARTDTSLPVRIPLPPNAASQAAGASAAHITSTSRGAVPQARTGPQNPQNALQINHIQPASTGTDSTITISTTFSAGSTAGREILENHFARQRSTSSEVNATSHTPNAGRSTYVPVNDSAEAPLMQTPPRLSPRSSGNLVEFSLPTSPFTLNSPTAGSSSVRKTVVPGDTDYGRNRQESHDRDMSVDMEMEPGDLLKRFRRLNVRHTQVDGMFWRVLTHMTRLKALILCGTNIGVHPSQDRNQPCVSGADALSQMKELRQLGLAKTLVDDAVLDAVADIQVLETLDLSYTNVSDTAVARYVGQMTRLRWLSLEETAVTDFALERLANLTQLRHLDLGDTEVSSYSITTLAGFRQLQSVNLSFTDVNDRGVKALRGLNELRVVSLEGEKISDAGLACLGGLAQLRELELYAARITDDGLIAFSSQPAAQSLLRLDLACCVRVGDAGVEAGVANISGLVELSLAQTGVTDRSVIIAIRKLARLQSLNMSHTDITDMSVAAARKHDVMQRITVQGCALRLPPEPVTSVTPAAAREPVLRIAT